MRKMKPQTNPGLGSSMFAKFVYVKSCSYCGFSLQGLIDFLAH